MFTLNIQKEVDEETIWLALDLAAHNRIVGPDFRAGDHVRMVKPPRPPGQDEAFARGLVDGAPAVVTRRMVGGFQGGTYEVVFVDGDGAICTLSARADQFRRAN